MFTERGKWFTNSLSKLTTLLDSKKIRILKAVLIGG